MADTHSKETRSFNMSRIKSKNTRPEILVRKFLFEKGFRYKLHDVKLPGKPDIILPKYKTVVFVHGCFWHCHKGCRYFVVPKSRKDYWIPKLDRNVQRDKINFSLLKKLGWRCLIVWECDLKEGKKNATLLKLTKRLKL